MASIEVRQRPKGTTFRVVWRTPEGIKKSKTWPTMEKANLWKSLIEEVGGDSARAAEALARQSSQAMTVSAVSDHRMELLRARSYTVQTYRTYMRNHISPAMGSWPVDTVSEDDCRRFVISLEKKGLSPKYIHNICGWLSSIFLHAEGRGWRSGNPMKSGMLPAVERSDDAEQDQFLTRNEAQAVIDRMPLPYRDAAALMLATGMRPAELRALVVGDCWLDQAQPVIRVTKAINQDRERGEHVGAVKSRASRRSIGLPPSAVEMLRSRSEGRESGGRLFPGARSDWMSEDSLSRSFAKAAEKARKDGKITKGPTLYALRHTHASLMLAAGMETWKLAAHLGHDETMTRKVYGHLMPDAQFEAAGYAAKALSS